MDKEQFVEKCFYGIGVIGRRYAKKYIKDRPDDYEYTEDDLIEVYCMTASDDSFLGYKYRDYEGAIRMH